MELVYAPGDGSVIGKNLNLKSGNTQVMSGFPLRYGQTNGADWRLIA